MADFKLTVFDSHIKFEDGDKFTELTWVIPNNAAQRVSNLLGLSGDDHLILSMAKSGYIVESISGNNSVSWVGRVVDSIKSDCERRGFTLEILDECALMTGEGE